MAKGDHFFFYCDELLDSANASLFDPLAMNKLCGLKSMQNGYPRTDNVNLVVRSLDCETKVDPKTFVGGQRPFN